MHRNYSLRDVVTVSVLASMLSVAALWFVQAVVVSPERAFAQASASSDVVLHAAPRGLYGESESFVFHNTKTDDIWVYRNQNFHYRYRLTQLGVDMEKFK